MLDNDLRNAKGLQGLFVIMRLFVISQLVKSELYFINIAWTNKMQITKFPHFSLPNPPPLAADIEPVDPEFTEALRREAGDDSPSP